MNSKEAIAKIKNLLFGLQTFSLVKTVDGVEMQCEGDMELEKEIYLITPDGNIPAEDGKYEMEDGMKLEVKEGKIAGLEYNETAEHDVTVEEDEEVLTEEGEVEVEEKMVSAELIDGTIVETDTEELAVGDSLFIKTEEGRIVAPDGEHETVDGNIVVVLDGVVTEIKEKVVEEETSTEEVSFDELLEVFTVGFNHLNEELNVMKEEYHKLNENFKKFSAEPAGERLYVRQEYRDNLKVRKMDKLTALAQLRKSNK